MCGLFYSRPQFKARGLLFMTSAKVFNFFTPSPLSLSPTHKIQGPAKKLFPGCENFVLALPLLPGLAWKIHATWEPFFCRALYISTFVILSTTPLPLEWGSHKWKLPNNANRNLNSLSCIANVGVSRRWLKERVKTRMYDASVSCEWGQEKKWI